MASGQVLHVCLDGKNWYLFDLLLVTFQGSVLGPVLYAIFFSPLFDIFLDLLLADDSYDMKSNLDKNITVKDVEKYLKAITKWLKKS